MTATQINVLLIDDDPIALGYISRMIKKNCPNLSIKGEAKSASEAREILDKFDIQVLFLDISMPEENGFDFLQSIDNSRYKVVFTTSYKQYTIKAMRANAVDYLMKPIKLAELKQVTDKLLKILDIKPQPNKAIELQKVPEMQVLKQDQKGVGRLSLPDMRGFTIIEVKDITHLEADCNYTIFHFINRSKIVVSKPIKLYENLLDNSVFFRIHKSCIINLRHLKEFSKIDGYYALMNDATSVSVSRRRIPEFIKAISHFNTL